MKTWQQHAPFAIGGGQFVPEELGREMCETCGKEYRLLRMPCVGGPNKGQPIVWKNGCNCGNIELARQAIAEDKRARALYIKRQFEENSLVSENLKRSSLDNYAPQNETQEKALHICTRFAENFKPGVSFNLLLYGPYGVGKSHLAYSICSSLVERGVTSVFISMPQLCTTIRDTYQRQGGQEGDVYRTLFAADFLVIDELGAEKKSEWTDDIIFKLVEGRAGKCTVYTSNLTKSDFQKRMTPRNFSKFSLDMHYLKIDGPDYRQQGANSL